jgi:hypothetical protein
MQFTRRRTVAVVALLAVGGACWITADTWAKGPVMPQVKKPPVVPPKPRNPVIITLDYRGGMLIRPATPYLQIHENGQSVVTDINGKQRHLRLTAAQLRALLGFITRQNNFLQITSAQISTDIQNQNAQVAIGDGTTTTITLSDPKTHSVAVYAADTYLQMFPNIKPLAEFVAIEQRLQTLANSAK